MKSFHARVAITLQGGMLDPQGEAVARTLQEMESLAGTKVSRTQKVRVGKLIAIELQALDVARARAAVADMCEQLLAHPVTECSEILTLEERETRLAKPTAS